MKILFYNHQGKISGAERVILLILKRLDQSSFESMMVCPEVGAMQEETKKLGVACETIDELEAKFTMRPDRLFLYFISFIKTIQQLRSEIFKSEPNLIHAVSTRSGLAATMASIGTEIPVVWHLHDPLPRHPLSTMIRAFAACFRRIRLMPVSNATGKSFRGKLLKSFGKHLREQVVHNGIELDKFEYKQTNRGKIRCELGLTDEELVFGIVGQITPRKGQLELLKTFAKTQKKLSSKLLVGGAPVFNQDEIYFEELKQTVKDLGIEQSVKFLGSRNDTSAIMQALDALVINSRSEALVLVAIEALACRTPVIATDVGGTNEIITDQQNGLLIPFGDEQALFDAMVTVGTDAAMRRRFAEEGEKIAVERFNAERFISQIEEFYKQNALATDEKPAGAKENLVVQS